MRSDRGLLSGPLAQGVSVDEHLAGATRDPFPARLVTPT